MKKPTFFSRMTAAVATLLLLVLPQSCKEKDAPAATSDGPTEISYHQLILECTESATLRKGVAILDFRFDTYDGGVVGFASGKYLSFGTTNYAPIDAALQTATTDIANQAAEVKTVSTMTDFVAGRLAKVPGYVSVKTLSIETIWGILGGEKTLLAQLDTKPAGWEFDVQKFLVALIATPAQAQAGNSIQAGTGYAHSNYFYSPPPQPGSPLPEYRFVNPVTPPQMPSGSTPVQRNSRGETPAEQAAREEAARAAAQAGRTNRGPRSVSDAFNGIFDRLGNPLGDPLGRAFGDPHLQSHDGLVYGFQTVGEFVATKGENLEIQARQEDAYKTGFGTVTTGVAARLGSDELCLLVNPAALNAPRFFVNKKEIALSALAPVALAPGNKLQLAAPEKLVFSNAQGEGVTIYWNKPYFNYAAMLGEARKGKVTGLMGNYDGDANNDFKLSNGTTPPVDHTFKTIHTLFADSWRVSNQTSLFVYEAGKNTDSYTDRAFPRAFPVLDADKLKWAEGVC
ncbi:MAG: VWD domain-containing protein, partial [Cytophagaceae bacterium]|nr:VWD domain-containing protein [Cytophagaceae bacterium]